MGNKVLKDYWKQSRRVDDKVRKRKVKANDSRLKDNPRNIIWGVRVTEQEREAITKRFGGLGKLRDYAMMIITEESRGEVDTVIK